MLDQKDELCKDPNRVSGEGNVLGVKYPINFCAKCGKTIPESKPKRIAPLKGNWVNDEGKLRKMEDKMQEIIHAMNLIREDTDRILAGNAHNERKT